MSASRIFVGNPGGGFGNTRFAVAPAGGSVYFPIGTGTPASNATESNFLSTMRVAGTMSHLIVVTKGGNRAGAYVKIRRNGGYDTGGLSVSLTSTPGEYEDTTGFNTFAVGDTVSGELYGGTGGSTFYELTQTGVVFTPEAGTVTRFRGGGGGSGYILNSAGASIFYTPPGQSPLVGSNTIQNAAEMLIRLPAGTPYVRVTNLYVQVTTGAAAGTATFTVIGGTGGGTSPTVTTTSGGGAQVLEDTTHSMYCVDGDKIVIRTNNGISSGTMNFGPIGFDIIDDFSGCWFINSTAPGTFNATNVYTGWAGGSATPTESEVQSRIGIVTRMMLASRFDRNTVTGALKLRANAADTAVSIASPAATNVWATDTSNTYLTAASDLINWRYDWQGTGPSFGVLVVTCQNDDPYDWVAGSNTVYSIP